MNKKKDLELFYILPYTVSYNSGGYYKDDDTGGIGYNPPSKSVWNGDSLIFEEKEDLLKWFYKNAGKQIPTVYRIKYIDNYLGVDDVFKITDLKDDKTEYYTALSEDSYAMYDENNSKIYDKNIWKPVYAFRYDTNRKFRFEYIYEEFIKRGIKIKFNVYEKNIDIKTRFEFIGDPRYERKAAEGKKLVLYNPHPKSFW